MITIYSDLHHRHHGHAELIDGKMMPCFEMPRRAEIVLARVREVGLGEVREPRRFGEAPIRRVHGAGFVDFLASAWGEWLAEGRTHDALPLIWPVRSVRGDRVPEAIDGKLGYYSFDAGVPITSGTWEAVQAGADVAVTGARVIADGAGSAFALCRPPGHHAASSAMGGYCYLNNAAIAAQDLVEHTRLPRRHRRGTRRGQIRDREKVQRPQVPCISDEGRKLRERRGIAEIASRCAVIQCEMLLHQPGDTPRLVVVETHTTRNRSHEFGSDGAVIASAALSDVVQ